MKKGIRILEDLPGSGDPVQRQGWYQIRLRMWLNKGDPIRWDRPWGQLYHARLEDDRATLITRIRFDREDLINGLFYGCEGMRVGGTRKLKISPHLAYGENGVSESVPPNAVLVAEIAFLEAHEGPG